MIEWIDDARLRVGDTRFLLAAWFDMKGSAERLLLCKTRAMVETYEDLVSRLRPRNIVELGIFRGGSTAFLAAAAKPDKLVAVEFEEQPCEPLEGFITAHDLEDVLKPYYGVDQADRPRVEAILDAEFGSSPLDLVVDDASHYLPETRASFNLLFPRLRPGGVYVIEDWQWAHARLEESPEGMWPERPPLSMLVFELVMACPSAPGAIAELSIDPTMVVVTRGEDDLDPDTFDIGACYHPRGRKLVAGL